MTSHKRSYLEIIEFLEDLQDTSRDLPHSVVGHWSHAIKICKDASPDWNRAAHLCKCIVTVVNKLQARGGDSDLLYKAQAQISILLGAINLGQKDWNASNYYFEQGARQLRHWGHTPFESLANFGRTLTHSQEGNWPAALEAAQQALDAIRNLSVPDKSAVTQRLQDRTEAEVEAITEHSIRGAVPSSPRLISIPILNDIAAGLGMIVEDSAVDQLVLDDDHRNGADFGVKVVGDSMKDACILPGDIVLIRKQPGVKIGEIAAVVITTPTGSKGVLKHYNLAFERRADLFHWYLKSRNPASENLVVMPSGVNVDKIKAHYDRAIRSGRIRHPIRYHRDSEVAVAGVYVGLLRMT
jgi:SOS-response transcriptional repressor LexA